MAVRNAIDVLEVRIKGNRTIIDNLKFEAKESKERLNKCLVEIGELETEIKNFEEAVKKLTESKQEVIKNIDKEQK